jgi:hypothetical protein
LSSSRRQETLKLDINPAGTRRLLRLLALVVPVLVVAGWLLASSLLRPRLRLRRGARK